MVVYRVSTGLVSLTTSGKTKKKGGKNSTMMIMTTGGDDKNAAVDSALAALSLLVVLLAIVFSLGDKDNKSEPVETEAVSTPVDGQLPEKILPAQPVPQPVITPELSGVVVPEEPQVSDPVPATSETESLLPLSPPHQAGPEPTEAVIGELPPAPPQDDVPVAAPLA